MGSLSKPAVNTVWEDFPGLGLCLYYTATSPAAVLDAAERTHPASSRLRHLLRERPLPAGRGFRSLPPCPTHWEQTTPMIELAGGPQPKPGCSIQIGEGRVADTILDDLLLGVTVAVSNALMMDAHQQLCGSGPRRAAS